MKWKIWTQRGPENHRDARFVADIPVVAGKTPLPKELEETSLYLNTYVLNIC